MILQQVTVSGTVGKQVIATNRATTVRGFSLTPSGANATIKIRDGGASAASGQVVFFGRAPSAQGTREFSFECPVKFSKGLHVTVIGANAEAYMYLE